MSDDAPIKPRNYLYGNKVVSIGEFTLSHGETVRKKNCRHRNCSYDTGERRVYCHDCQSVIEPFDAFMMLVNTFEVANRQIAREKQEIIDAQKHTITTRAAKTLDKAWRRKSLVPCCPHCRAAILPGDVSSGVMEVSKELELARRKKGAEKHTR